jgi:hypothetical protein
VSKPALDWPLLAFIRTSSDYERLILGDFSDVGAPTFRRVARTPLRDDLGRPALRGGRLAWQKVTRHYSRVVVEWLETGRRWAIADSEISVVSNPSLTGKRIMWVDQRAHRASLFVRRFGNRGARRIYNLKGRDRRLLTTAMVGRMAYVTRWTPKTGASTLVRVIF